VANEEYDKALTSYRNGMSADMRHYNAWYGVGRVYEKLGTYDKAFIHFESAARINPTNAVLTTCIGTVLEKQKQPAQALKYYTKATELAPRSSLTRYKKARALMTIGDMEGAMQELMILKDIAPDAAMVHFQLGKLYKALKNKGAAVKHFTIALNLDPKVSSVFSGVSALSNIFPGESADQGCDRGLRRIRRRRRTKHDGVKMHLIVRKLGLDSRLLQHIIKEVYLPSQNTNPLTHLPILQQPCHHDNTIPTFYGSSFWKFVLSEGACMGKMGIWRRLFITTSFGRGTHT